MTNEIKRAKALLVEDSPMVQRVHTWMLENELGYQVDLAPTGQAALQQLETAQKTGEHYEIALVDMGLPDMDGIEVIKALKKNHPSTKAIVVTACVSDSVINSCSEAGSDLVLKKPITGEVLSKHLEKL